MSFVTRQKFYPLLLLFVWAFFLRLFQVSSPPVKAFDELFYPYTGHRLLLGDRHVYDFSYEDRRHEGIYARYHPPLGSLIIGAGVLIFGDRPLGWRFFPVLFASLAVVGVYLICLFLMRSRVWASLTALLYNSDFLGFLHSRLGILDPILTGVLVGGVCLYFLLYRNYRSSLRKAVAFGCVMGLSLAVKWSTLFNFAVLSALLVLEAVIKKRLSLWRDVAVIGSTCLLVYAAIFSVFLPKVAWRDFIGLQKTVFLGHYQRAGRSGHLNRGDARAWWRWPLDFKPVRYYVSITSFSPRPPTSRFLQAYGNPLLYWALVPASLWLLFFSYRRGSLSTLGLPALLFFANWIPWAFSPRPTFWFYFLPAVPFGTISLGIALKRLWDKGFKFPVGAYVFSVIVLFFILYPTFTAMTIPDKVFRFLDRIFGPMPP